MKAVDNGHAGVVEFLLETAKQRSRSIANYRNKKGETALHKAAATGTVADAKEGMWCHLANAGLTLSSTLHLLTPLHVCCMRFLMP